MIHVQTAFVVSLLMLISFVGAEPVMDNDDFPVVKTSFGPVQGLMSTSSWTNKPIYSFQGIPYASPPVGNLRFKDPVLPEKWTTTMNCTMDQSSCLQNPDPTFALMNITFNLSEDCLFLNVFTPQIKPENGLLPVMVWVHGGGFVEGSGSYIRWGPDFLVGEGVVVVSFNYRLGALGFLTLGTPDMPGNSALKDQLLALKWVQREIHQFGGDPSQVTLFGESAGSASVHLHYLSPLSKGLFQRVIGESGTALGSWAVRNNGKHYAILLAEALSCSTADDESVRKCLMAADAQAIFKAQSQVTPDPGDSSLVFIPSIDKNTSTEPFLPDFPIKLLEQKKGSFVPFIMGINSDEGIMGLAGIGSEEQLENVTNNLEEFIPINVRKDSTQARLKTLEEKIKQFYFKDGAPTFKNFKGYIDLYTDTAFGYATAVSARHFRERGTVYLYYFSFDGAFKEKLVLDIEHKYNFSGVCHAEELGYLFVEKKVNQSAPEASKEMLTWKRMVRMWTNFAKFGKPTVGPDSDLQDVVWSSVGNVTTNYLHIDVNLTMVKEDFLGPSVALWDSITSSTSATLHATRFLIMFSILLYLLK